MRYPVGPIQFRLGLLFVGLGIVSVLTALAFQHIGGFVPCRLCLEQREPYYTSVPIVIALLIVVAFRGPACLVRGFFLVVALFMAYGAVTGFYQAGAEWQIWPGPSDCTGDALSLNAGNLLQQMKTTRIVPCDQAAIRILGLSFVGWNVFASGFLMLVALAAAILPAKLAWRAAT
ncbi:MAG: disulfide bond formation protein B [Hyphomicrobiales bacterium]|nr:disulfide bond formation protein B [Hyphomicrobiales bacterium]